jgi:formamidopyrimidine-DNA glycosylase
VPELPEVEHARRRLARHVAGRRVRAVHLPDPAVIRTRVSTRPRDAHPAARALAAGLVGAVPQVPLRHGKRLGWRIGGQSLLGHLGMSGRWIDRAEPPEHGRVGLSLEDGTTWWLEDPRRFGCLAPAEEPLEEAVRAGLGPDAWTEAPDGPTLGRALGGRAGLKARLLDQTRLAGIGNIQATEALWKAGLHPGIRADALGPGDWVRLAEGLRWTLSRTLEDAGEGELVYVSQDPSQSPFQVYGRAGAPCPACGSPLAQGRFAGRTSPWCPSCQPDPDAAG